MTKSVPSLERRQRERVQTRQKILDAARRMFVQRGYEAPPMRAIAAKMGYTPMPINSHAPRVPYPEEVAQIAWGAMHGLVALHIAKVDDPWNPWRDVSETAARACDALLRGLVREPET